MGDTRHGTAILDALMYESEVPSPGAGSSTVVVQTVASAESDEKRRRLASTLESIKLTLQNERISMDTRLEAAMLQCTSAVQAMASQASERTASHAENVLSSTTSSEKLPQEVHKQVLAATKQLETNTRQVFNLVDEESCSKPMSNRLALANGPRGASRLSF